MILFVIQADTTVTLAGIAALYSALFTIGAALLYPLGLLILGWPMIRITGNFSTGLYALSLLSKTVVAVQGIRIFLNPFLTNIAVLLLISGSIFVANLLNGLARPIVELFGGGDIVASVAGYNFSLGATLSFIVIQVIILGFLAAGGRKIRKLSLGVLGPPHGYSGMGVLRLLNSVVTVAIVIWVVYFGEYSWWQTVFSAITIIYVGAFSVSLPAATLTTNLPLPKARVMGLAEGPLIGTLLDHSDGFWHLINEDGDFLAVPGSKVEVVRIDRERP